MTTGYLLDTNVLGSLARVRSGCIEQTDIAIANRYEKIKDSAQLFICAITVGECQYGLKVAPKKDHKRQQAVLDILKAFPQIFEIDHKVAEEHYSDIKAGLFHKYAPKDAKKRARSNFIEEWIDPASCKTLGIDEHDVWIAAVAMHYNLVLVSGDKMQHIREVCGKKLHMENWKTSEVGLKSPKH